MRQFAFPDNAPLQCSIVEVEEYPFHMHDDVLEIMFALEGSFELTVVNNVLDMKAGDIYVSCPQGCTGSAPIPTPGDGDALHINGRHTGRSSGPADLPVCQQCPGEQYRGIQMLGSYLKAAPRLLDRTGTGDGCLQGGGEKILNTLVGGSSALSGQRLSRVQQRLQGKQSSSSGASAGSRTTSTATTTSLSALEDVAAMEHISANHLTNILANGRGRGFRTFLNMARVRSRRHAAGGGQGAPDHRLRMRLFKAEYFSDSFEKSFRTHATTVPARVPEPHHCGAGI